MCSKPATNTNKNMQVQGTTQSPLTSSVACKGEPNTMQCPHKGLLPPHNIPIEKMRNKKPTNASQKKSEKEKVNNDEVKQDDQMKQVKHVKKIESISDNTSFETKTQFDHYYDDI